MYIPKHFAEDRTDVLHNLIQQRSFGTLVTLDSGSIEANHLPFILSPAQGPFGTLQCHIARGNPLWQQHQVDSEVLAIFQGPDAYISPSWYPSKQEGGKVVPTWNYQVVHAYGSLRIMREREWLRDHLECLSNHHEAGRENQWQVKDAPAEFIERMMAGIVGIEITITRLLGKSKVSQNQPEANKQGVVDGLTREGTGSAEALGKLI